MSWRASAGLRAWAAQRLSAIYVAVFLAFHLILLLLNGGLYEYQQWRDWVSQPFVNIAMGLFFFALLLHAWIGMRDVVLDYVKPFPLRLSVLSLMMLAFMAMGVWVLRVLFLINAGS